MKKLLVTGISGFLGWNVAHFQQKDWQIVGTYRTHQPETPEHIACHSIDLTDSKATSDLIEKIQPDAVLHLAANSSTGFCQKHPEQTFGINVEVPHFLAKICQKGDIPLVFTSSEQVFNGLKDSYTETDLLNPRNTYGSQKAEAERLVLQANPDACVVRVSVMYGEHGRAAYCFSTDWLNKWKNDEPVTVFTDEIRSFLNGEEAAAGLFLLLNKKAKGIYHLGGKEALSRYEFALRLRKEFGYPNGIILKKLQREVDVYGRRPPRLVLENGKIDNLEN